MQEKDKKITVEIEAFDPGRDQSPRVKKFEVPFAEESSVLDILEYIYENLDPSIGYYASCRRGVCARCIIKVNGKARFACTEQVAGEHLKLGPARADKIVRDLKIDDLR